MYAERPFQNRLADAFASLDVLSIARGYKTLDVIAKRAAVKIEVAKPVSSGRFVIVMSGAIAEVEESYCAALECVLDGVLDHVILTSPHEQVKFGVCARNIPSSRSVLIAEFETVSSTLAAVDAVLKNCDVNLGSIRLADGIAGKGIATLCGDLCEVEASRDIILAKVHSDRIVALELIAQPHAEVVGFF